MQLTLYLIIIGVCVLAVSACVSAIYRVFFFYVLGITLIATAGAIIIDALTAAVCRMLPKRCADYKSKIFTVSRREKKFYEKLKIKKWKDKIPEIGHFTGFRKNRIAEPDNPEYILRFLTEICYGELGHTVSVFTGFLLLALPIFPPVWFTVSIFVAVINGILNLLPVAVLRYNSYKLLIIYKRLLQKT